jgi:hypothetical protein
MRLPEKQDKIPKHENNLKYINRDNMAHSNDQLFLSGKRSTADEIRDSYRALSDLWQGISIFQDISNCVTVYGSARFGEDHPYYIMARQLGKALAENGFAVMTGGGPGIMEAANRGAKEGGVFRWVVI